VSVVVLGLSHRSAPITVLESVALDADRAAALARAVRSGENIGEAVVLATCNRVEVYADAATFHGAVTEIGDALAAAAGVPLADLREHLYVHYEDRAIAHAFSVACGLDSMAVGEGQILGQLRDALRAAQADGQAGGALSSLFQQALRVGKRAHAETGIDRVSVSLVESGLEHAARTLGPLEGTRVLVVGAGSMSSLAATTVSRLGARDLVIINRTLDKAERPIPARPAGQHPHGPACQRLHGAEQGQPPRVDRGENDAQRSLEAADPVRRLAELDSLVDLGVRGVVRGDRVGRAVEQGGEARGRVTRCT